MTLILPFQNQIRGIMKKGKRNQRKWIHSTQYPNRTFNEDKNEDDKKVFRQMQTKISFKSIRNLENVKQFKTLIKSETFYQSST